MDVAQRLYPSSPAPSAPPASPAPAPAPSPAAASVPASSAPASSGETDDDLRAPADPAAQAPASYSFDLPSDFAPPPEIPLSKIDATTPLAKAAAAYAREHNLTQGQFSSLLKVYANHAISEAQAYRKSIEQEGQKLGPRAAERGQAVRTWLVDRLGVERAADLVGRFNRASDIEAFEKLRGDRSATSVLDRWYGPSR